MAYNIATTSGNEMNEDGISYDALFSSLSAASGNTNLESSWDNDSISKLQVKRHTITQVFHFRYKIPRELHKYLIGRGGSTIKDLQEKTCTTISIPKPDQNSDVISIHGPKDGIDRAIHELQSICDEQSNTKTGFERLKIPKKYHPWIRGPYNETLNQLMQLTGAKINMPPIDLDKDEITITGDKDKVDLACAQVMKIVNKKKQVRIRKVEFQITQTQHKFIIGKNGQTVQDIFKDFDVYVVVPRADLNSDTITLFGEDSKIGAALTQVYAKANSIIITQIPAPTWLHRYIIGEKYSNIIKITANYPGTYVKFENDNKITLEGPPDEIEKLKEKLNMIIKELEQKLTFYEININQKFYGHVIGKNHENVTRIKQDYGVQVRLTPENSDQSSIRIEGLEEGVQKAKHEIEELLKRLENERSKDIIIDQKYHSNLIGQGGKNIAEIRNKFNGVNISIPNADKKSDIITVRGNKTEVERCCKHLQQLAKEFEESNYKEELHIFKNFHKMIIGKQGVVIRKIKDETNTRIDVPADHSDSDTISITGKKDNVIKARKLIEDKVKELIKIEEDFVDIPHNLHTALIGRGGAIIKEIRRDCGNCIITFPPENKPNDRIILKGPREDIEKAKQELLKVAKQRNELSYTAEVSAKVEYHRYLVGRKGNNVSQLREKYNVRIIFPQSDGNNNNTNSAENGASNVGNDTITIIGKKENVKKVKAELEETIESLDDLIDDFVEVDPKWHTNFTAKRGKLINKISDDNCNVKISFPKAPNASKDTNKKAAAAAPFAATATSNIVKLSGPKEAVHSAKKKISEIVYELEHQVTIEVVIPQKYHVAVIGKKGVNSQHISEEYHVELIFPAKLTQNKDESQQQSQMSVANGIDGHNVAGEANEQDSATQSPSKFDIVLITGLKENCEKAKEALLKLVPISETFDFPSEFHKNLLANKAEALREIKAIHPNVQIVVPKKGDDANYITLFGLQKEIDSAKETLKERLEKFEAEKKDRELKNFTIEFEIKPEYIQFLRGQQGAEAIKLGEKFDCHVDFSRKNEPADKVVLRGYEKNVLTCKKEILRRIGEYDSKIMEKIEIDSRVHSRIIGAQGKKLKKIIDKFKVDIKFPGRGSRSKDSVILQGDNAEAINDAIDYLKNLEEEYLQSQIKEETNTRIDVPAHNSDSDTILITGKKKNVIKARKLIDDELKENNELIKIEEDYVDIPHNLHAALIGRDGAIIKEIRRDCGNCIIAFPPENKPNDRITLKGLREDIKKARQELLKLVPISETFNFPSKFHKNLLGKKAVALREINAIHPNVQIVVPKKGDDANFITLFGLQKEIDSAKETLKERLEKFEAEKKDREFKNFTIEFEIKSENIQLLPGKQGAGAIKLGEKLDCRVDFSRKKEPPDNSDSDTILITGKKDNVIKARKLNEDKVKELIKIEEDFVDIPHNLHTALIGRGGAIIKEIRRDCGNCIITFPPENKPNDRIILKGPREDIEKTKQELLKLVPISETFDFPSEFHKNLLAKKAVALREIKAIHPNVRIVVPKKGDDANYIILFGLQTDIDTAKTTLKEHLEKFEAKKKDRELKNFTIEFEIKPKYLKLLRGNKGAEAIKLGKKFDCRVDFSRKKEPTNKVVLKGYKINVLACKKEILRRIREYDSIIMVEIEIDSRVHSRIIGAQGKNLKKVIDKFKVDIKFPRRRSRSKDPVILQCDNAEAIDDAIGYLKHLEEKYLQSQIKEETNTRIDVPAHNSDSDTISITGKKDNVIKARKLIDDELKENNELIKIEEDYVDIPHNLHAALIGRGGAIIKEIRRDCGNCIITFPPKNKANDRITLKGPREDIEKTKQELLKLLPISETFDFPSEFHKNLLANKSEALREIKAIHPNVRIVVPKKGDDANYIILFGLQKNIDTAKKTLKERLKKFEAEKKDRELKNFTIEFEIKPKYIKLLRGKRGAESKKLGKIFDCRVDFSRKKEPTDKVVLRGYEKNVLACNEEILRRIGEYDSKIMEEI